nr:coiled-coil domain-containing protein 96 [Paramormyrops kingsleyae]
MELEESSVKTELLMDRLNSADDSESTEQTKEDESTEKTRTGEKFDDKLPGSSGSDDKIESATGNTDTAEGTGDAMYDNGDQETGASHSNCEHEEGIRTSESAEPETRVTSEAEVGQEVRDELLDSKMFDQEESGDSHLLTRETLSGEEGRPFTEVGTVMGKGALSVSPSTPEQKGCLVEEVQGSELSYEESKRELEELQAERDQLSQLNGQFQAKLAEYFLQRRGEEEQTERSDGHRYLVFTSHIQEIRQQHQQHKEHFGRQEEELRQQVQESLRQAELEWQVLQARKQEVAGPALAWHLGKESAKAQMEQIQAAERHKEKELARVRLENIKLKAGIAKGERALSAKKGLAEGLHILDFEQLKLENQTYSDKVEERDEEILKLRNKIAGAVRVLTHVKEKLQWVQMENRTWRSQLAEMEAAVARSRDSLTRAKRARDRVRADNLRLHQRSGLLGNSVLLRDMEERVGDVMALELRLGALKSRN